VKVRHTSSCPTLKRPSSGTERHWVSNPITFQLI